MNRNEIIGVLMLLPIILIIIVVIGLCCFINPKHLCLLFGLSIIVSTIVAISLCLAEKGIRKINEKN